MPRQTATSFRKIPDWERDETAVPSRLTPREQQILDLIGKGKTTKEIAGILNLSTGTIGNHRKGLCRKLDTHSTAELVYRAAVGMR
ncbi:MAG TPA: helix-turn-helix transcriptional regulator [Bryobacteraceae bacterium]|jgi:DNA-binding CsgD family transcriptional regulator